MKRALVFAGGGSRGAYEYGAWKALEELNQKFDIVTGTSIGSVNGALYVQRDFDAAGEMWDELIMENVMVDAFIPDEHNALSDLIDHKNLVRSFFRRYLASKGADNSPFIATVSKYIDEAAFRRSDIDFALVTIKYRGLVPVVVNKADMDAGSLRDWVQTSCACFPIFPKYKLGDEMYIDGGYYDNLPIAASLRLGAQEIVAIDLNHNCGHPAYVKHPLVKYIRPREDLGSIMAFDRKETDRLRILGYNDTMKAFGKLRGDTYSFYRGVSALMLDSAAEDFTRRLSLMEATADNTEDSLFALRSTVNAECTAYLAELCGKSPMSASDCFLTALELTMRLLGFETAEIYSFDDAAGEILSRCGETGIDRTIQERIGKMTSLIKKVTDIKGKNGKREEMIVLALIDTLLQFCR